MSKPFFGVVALVAVLAALGSAAFFSERRAAVERRISEVTAFCRSLAEWRGKPAPIYDCHAGNKGRTLVVAFETSYRTTQLTPYTAQPYCRELAAAIGKTIELVEVRLYPKGGWYGENRPIGRTERLTDCSTARVAAAQQEARLLESILE